MMIKVYGFTLIELMLALAISAILIALGYPTYIGHQTQAERNRAEIALLQLAGRLEIYFNDNGSYANATAKALHVKNLVEGLHYKLVIANASDEHYDIEAIPTGIQAKRDLGCETLSLTDTNARSISGDGDVKQCWL